MEPRPARRRQLRRGHGRLGRRHARAQRALARARWTPCSRRRPPPAPRSRAEGAETFWGGYSGVFLDPDGHPWEVAHNPHWTLRDDGSVELSSNRLLLGRRRGRGGRSGSASRSGRGPSRQPRRCCPSSPAAFHQRPPGAPAAVREAAFLRSVDRVRGARVLGEAHPRRARAAPAGSRSARTAGSGARRRTAGSARRCRSTRKMRWSRRSSAVRRAALARRLVAGRDPVLVQAPHRRQRLVERGAPAARLLVAVPAAVRPLPLDERLGQQLHARVRGQAEAAADGERVSLLRAAAARQAVDRPGSARCALPVSQASTVSAAARQRGSPAGTPSSTSETSRQCAPPHLP